MIQALVRTWLPGRALVRFGRRGGIAWGLMGVGLIAAVISQASAWGVVAVGLIGVGVAWELLGRRARANGELLDSTVLGHQTQGSPAMVALLADALGFVILMILGIGWASVDGSDAVVPIVLGASALGGWLILSVFRQGWRLPIGLLSLVAVTLVGIWSASTALRQPAPVEVWGIEVWARLLVIVGAAVLVDRWARPIGEVERWRERLVDAMVLVPAMTGVLVFVCRPAGEILSWHVAVRALWLVVVGVCLVVVLAVLSSGVVRVSRDVMESARRLMGGRRHDRRSARQAHLVLSAIPAVVLSAGSDRWMWLTATALFGVSVVLGAIESRRRRRAIGVAGIGRAASGAANENGAAVTSMRHRQERSVYEWSTL